MAGAAGKRKQTDPSELRTGIITALSVKGTSGERVAVYMDGARVFDVSAVVAQNAGLRKDEELTRERQVELLREDEPYRAREAALGLLGRRDLPSAELASRLRDRGISEEQAEATVAWLSELGYVDDGRYAAAYMSAKINAGWGRRRIASELYQKGIDRATVDESWRACAEEGQDADVCQQLIDLVHKRFGRQLISDPDGARRRISGFLARRGHDWDTIAEVLSVLKQGDESSIGE